MKRAGFRAISTTALVLALIAPLAGCYRHTIIAGTGAPSGRLLYDHWENFWIIGLVGHKTLDVAQICPSGNATIEAKQTFLNGLVSALTSGIYTPTTLRLHCQDGGTASIPLGIDDVRRIVSDERFPDWVRSDAPELFGSVVEASPAPTP
jgi:hypothetical protein